MTNLRGAEVHLSDSMIWRHDSTDIDFSIDDDGTLKVFDYAFRAEHGEHSGLVLIAHKDEWTSAALVFGESGLV